MSQSPDSSLHSIRLADVASFLAALVFALNIAGYPVAGLLSAVLNLPSVLTSIPFRIAVILLSFVLASITIVRCRLRWPTILMLAFWFAYLIRLVWDTTATDLQDAARSMQLFLAVVVGPAAALILATRNWDDVLAAKLLFFIGGIVTLASLTLDWSDLIADHSLTEMTSRLSTDTLNPITLGHVAVSVLLSAYCLLEPWKGRGARFILATACVLSIVCLALAGSKGPIVSLGAATLFLLVVRRGRATLPLALTCIVGAVLLMSNTPLAERVLGVAEDESTSARITLTTDALQQIVSHPLFGSAFVELNSQTYPHNLVIEAMMALGIPMGLAFVWLCIYGLWSTFRLRRENSTFLSLIFVQYLVGGFLSGSLYASGAFWAALALLINAPDRVRYRAASTFPSGDLRQVRWG